MLETVFCPHGAVTSEEGMGVCVECAFPQLYPTQREIDTAHEFERKHPEKTLRQAAYRGRK